GDGAGFALPRPWHLRCTTSPREGAGMTVTDAESRARKRASAGAPRHFAPRRLFATAACLACTFFSAPSYGGDRLPTGDNLVRAGIVDWWRNNDDLDPSFRPFRGRIPSPEDACLQCNVMANSIRRFNPDARKVSLGQLINGIHYAFHYINIEPRGFGRVRV